MQQFEQTQRTYHSSKEAERGHREMAKEGWQVFNVATSQPRAGLGRVALLGFGALVLKPKPEILVIYQRVPRLVEPTEPRKTIKEAWSKEGWAQAWQDAKRKQGLK